MKFFFKKSAVWLQQGGVTEILVWTFSFQLIIKFSLLLGERGWCSVSVCTWKGLTYALCRWFYQHLHTNFCSLCIASLLLCFFWNIILNIEKLSKLNHVFITSLIHAILHACWFLIELSLPSSFCVHNLDGCFHLYTWVYFFCSSFLLWNDIYIIRHWENNAWLTVTS